MTDRDYLTNRTRDQIADALGGGALADIFVPLWNAIGQDEAEQLQAIGYALPRTCRCSQPSTASSPSKHRRGQPTACWQSPGASTRAAVTAQSHAWSIASLNGHMH